MFGSFLSGVVRAYSHPQTTGNVFKSTVTSCRRVQMARIETPEVAMSALAHSDNCNVFNMRRSDLMAVARCHQWQTPESRLYRTAQSR